MSSSFIFDKKQFFLNMSILLLVALFSYFFIDNPTMRMVHAYGFETWKIYMIISLLGKFSLLLPIALIIWLTYYYVNKINHFYLNRLILSLISSNILASLLKIVLGRARPFAYYTDGLYGFYGMKFDSVYWSMPSGHSVTIVTISLVTTLLYPRYQWWMLFIAGMVILTRVLLLKHFVSDVILGVMCAYFAVYWLNIKRYFEHKGHAID
jgi:membrane-associated phospholipid phosphatase